MANNKMLIDASHPEETRVVVVKGNRIEEFDFESEHKKQLKGNIYLAKVTRVEPSLQAAFVDYGGNRHGFLAFSEIHPDYYQIPVADRQALIEEELARVQEDEDSEPAEEAKPAKPARRSRRSSKKEPAQAAAATEETIAEAVNSDESGEDASTETAVEADATDGEPEAASDDAPQTAADDSQDMTDDDDGSEEADKPSEDDEAERPSGRRRGRRSRASTAKSNSDEDSDDEAEEVDEVGAEDAMEEVPTRQSKPRRQYKIQEVIKRRQILLVQVVKEERGNKGAALTTYLSLAGRYSVLMPNTARGGGISRKITNPADRKRLKEMARDLKVPQGMGIILRTAGANRTKPEIKRDYDYLMRLWETVRTVTLSSTAPALVYEEGSLIKRSIRDLHNRDIDQILVAGEDGYREAKDFMRMLMPSQAKVVQPYRDATPIFARQGIEAQLDRMLQPHVTLKSGGYIIINQTEALVAIDVNSGRSTREHSIEDTAFQTNLEAAEEVARQLRLRDLAGLIVIDFIDMEEKRNNRAVEKKLKDCLKDDRARIQLGRISHFGLMEMSRQRIRASVLESTTQICPHCEGAGYVRSNSSLALHVLRSIEEHLQKHSDHDLVVKVPAETALYVLNEKRGTIGELEAHHGVRIIIQADDSAGRQSVVIEHGAEAVKSELVTSHVHPETVVAEDVDEDETLDTAAEQDDDGDNGDNGSRNKRKRRRSKRRRDQDDRSAASESEDGSSNTAEDEMDSDADSDDAQDDDQGGRNRRRRRRGRRGGRKNRDGQGDSESPSSDDQPAVAASDDDAEGGAMQEPVAESAFESETATPSPDDEPSEGASAAVADTEATPAAETADVAVSADTTPAEPIEAPAIEPAVSETADAADESAPASAEEDESPAAPAEETTEQPPSGEPQITFTGTGEDDADKKPKRTGWWSRRGFF
ncbi:Rne/Rng family ribonuclease [Consotaella aegiceratis]|uniref:Rne/Rng family ribonuclease n=1 Tax=Consotaella aegiceratis TaxID=3097961 RepID=UPI002F405175